MSLLGAADEVMVKTAVPPSSLMEGLSLEIERIGYGLTPTIAWTMVLGSILGPMATAWISRDWTVVVRAMVRVPLEAFIFFAELRAARVSGAEVSV